MLKLIFIVMVIVYVISCLFLILVILGQEGKGGGLSGLAGASALGDTFGASAAESTLRRWTRNTAILFVVLSLGLTLVGARVIQQRDLIDDATAALPPSEVGEDILPTTGPSVTEVDARTTLTLPTTDLPSTPAATTTGTIAPAPAVTTGVMTPVPALTPPPVAPEVPASGAAPTSPTG